jgi:PKD repeat protein
MAAPSITVSFTSDVNSGAPPFDVQFTDTTIVTDGFARLWFWDFGDGGVSTEQDPVHTFDGSAGEAFTVTLTIVATTTEFASLLKSDINAIAQSGGSDQSGSGSSESAAWDAFNAASPVSGTESFVTFWLTRSGSTTRQYKQINVIVRLETNYSNALYILTVNPTDLEIFQGAIITSFGHWFTPMSNTPRQVHSRVLGLLPGFPVEIGAWVDPIANLPDTTTPNTQHGMSASFTLRTYRISGTQDFSDHAEADFIVIGVPPIAEFNAAPVKGPDGLNVQFENLSTPAIGAPTTYSWKKRIHGSGDSFVEFSTAENPIEIFTK